MKLGKTYSPVVVSYKSVNARFVGVTLIHFAMSLMNNCFVVGPAIAATNISQSSRFARQLLSIIEGAK